MAEIKIERRKKNIMRGQLEEILKIQKDIDSKIDDYYSETEVPEYQRFWKELKQTNTQTIQKLSNYMVRKCNR